MRRGIVKITLEQKSSGCKDLSDARPLVTTKSLKDIIDTYFDVKLDEHC